jgi:hypothetical protein
MPRERISDAESAVLWTLSVLAACALLALFIAFVVAR